MLSPPLIILQRVLLHRPSDGPSLPVQEAQSDLRSTKTNICVKYHVRVEIRLIRALQYLPGTQLPPRVSQQCCEKTKKQCKADEINPQKPCVFEPSVASPPRFRHSTWHWPGLTLMHIRTPVYPSLAMTFDICSHLTATSAHNCTREHVCWGSVRCFLCYLHVHSFVFFPYFLVCLLLHRVLLY